MCPFNSVSVLVQMVVWHQTGVKQLLEQMLAKPLNELMLAYCHLVLLQTYFSKILIKMQTFLLEENAFQNVVCRMPAILFQPPCVAGPWNRRQLQVNSINYQALLEMTKHGTSSNLKVN